MDDFKDAYTIAEFCQRHGISPAQYFADAREGRGPRTMRIGSRGVRISKESAADYRRAREAEVAKTSEAEAA